MALLTVKIVPTLLKCMVDMKASDVAPAQVWEVEFVMRCSSARRGYPLVRRKAEHAEQIQTHCATILVTTAGGLRVLVLLANPLLLSGSRPRPQEIWTESEGHRPRPSASSPTTSNWEPN